MWVTFSDLFQFVLVLIGAVSVAWTIAKAVYKKR